MDEIEIIRAKESDLDTILQIQYAAFKEEAEAFNDYSIDPLLQTKDDLLREFSCRVFLKAVCKGEIVGSVRAHGDRDTAYIGRLIVRPDFQNRGLGRQLLSAAEGLFPHTRCELVVAKRMEKNARLYKNCGYAPFKEVQDDRGLVFVYMEKHR